MEIKLSTEDRRRLGVPDDLVVTFEPEKLMAREAVALKRETGYSIQRLGELMSGEPCPTHRVTCKRCRRAPCEAHAAGRACADHERIDDGCDACQSPCDDCGEVDVEAILPMAWIALYRAGIRVPYADFDFNVWAAFGEDATEGNDDAGSTSAESATPETTSTTS